MRTAKCAILLLLGAATTAAPFLSGGQASASESALTFFGWSDQHVPADGDGRHLIPAIDAMNALPGTRFPAGIGGEVAKPDFVIAVLGGHYHKAKVDRLGGVHFVQLPSPAPNGSNEITVFRITTNRLVAIPYNYRQKAWTTDRSKILDVPIHEP